jgi:acyl-coenzyme A thioesterase PaaI-like protein
VDLIADAHLLKLGKRLSVSSVRLFSEGRSEPVAHATVTYAIMRASEHRS